MQGHLEVLRFLHENGCPWLEETCATAAQFGHLEVLEYARANGSPWRRDKCLVEGNEDTRA